jgi:hypothetical protein
MLARKSGHSQPAMRSTPGEGNDGCWCFAVDALFHRYISLISVMQDRLFKSIAIVEQEDVDRISRRDLTELMEKLGALSDAGRFSEGAIARNILAHTYLSHVDDKAERLNEALRTPHSSYRPSTRHSTSWSGDGSCRFSR